MRFNSLFLAIIILYTSSSPAVEIKDCEVLLGHLAVTQSLAGKLLSIRAENSAKNKQLEIAIRQEIANRQSGDILWNSAFDRPVPLLVKIVPGLKKNWMKRKLLREANNLDSSVKEDQVSMERLGKLIEAQSKVSGFLDTLSSDFPEFQIWFSKRAFGQAGEVVALEQQLPTAKANERVQLLASAEKNLDPQLQKQLEIADALQAFITQTTKENRMRLIRQFYYEDNDPKTTRRLRLEIDGYYIKKNPDSKISYKEAFYRSLPEPVWRTEGYAGVAGVYNPITEQVEWRTAGYTGVAGVYNPITKQVEWRTAGYAGVAGVYNPITKQVEWRTADYAGVAGVYNPITEQVEWRTAGYAGIAGFFNPKTEQVEWKTAGYAGIAVVIPLEGEVADLPFTASSGSFYGKIPR